MRIVDGIASLIGSNRTSYLLTFIGITFWFLGNTLGAEDKNLSFGLIIMWRGIVTTLVAYAIIRYQGDDCYSKSPSDNYYLFGRSLASIAYCVVLIVSLRFLSNPVVQTINNSGPIIVFVINIFESKREVTRNEIIGTTIACLSLFLTIYSGSQHNSKKSNFEYIQVSEFGKILIIVISFVSLIAWAYGVLVTKKIKKSGSIVINLNLGLWSTFTGALIVIFQEKSFPFDLKQYLWVSIAVGGTMAASGFLYILALKMTDNVGTLTLINFVTVIQAYFFSYFRYGQELSVLGVVGSIGIFVSLLYLTKQ